MDSSVAESGTLEIIFTTELVRGRVRSAERERTAWQRSVAEQVIDLEDRVADIQTTVIVGIAGVLAARTRSASQEERGGRFYGGGETNPG